MFRGISHACDLSAQCPLEKGRVTIQPALHLRCPFTIYKARRQIKVPWLRFDYDLFFYHFRIRIAAIYGVSTPMLDEARLHTGGEREADAALRLPHLYISRYIFIFRSRRTIIMLRATTS